ncbi:MAG: response regulator [Actinomycetota bacterium]|nr:response regulator [Actinomycetota bacterium]
MPDSPAPEPVSVLVVDDQAPFRGAARAVLQMAAGFELVGEAESGEEAVELATALAPALVLMDINMTGISGIEATRLITADHPDTMVVLLSTYHLDDLPAEARTSGAAAYVHKEELSPRMLRRLWEERGDTGWTADGVPTEGDAPAGNPRPLPNR